MSNLRGESKDILQENIEQLKQLFPEVCCEDKIDFDKLKQILGEYVDDDRERYNFTWNGKGRSLYNGLIVKTKIKGDFNEPYIYICYAA